MLINNAGIMPLGPFVDEDDATAQRMVDINVHGVIYGMKLALPRMQRRGTRPHRQHRLAGGQGRASRRRHLLRAPSTPSSALSEAVRAELRDTEIEVSVRDAGGRQHRARLRAAGDARRSRSCEPEDVAEAIVEALERPKFDVWVPRVERRIDKLMHPLPRGAREAIGRLLKADKVLAEPDPSAARRLRGPRRPLGAGARARGGEGRTGPRG